MQVFDFSIFTSISAITFILEGVGDTLLLTFAAISIGLIIGSLLSFGEVYAPPFFAIPVRLIGEILRGIPLMVFFFLLFLGLRLDVWQSAIIGLGLRSAAFQGQILRSSLEAVSIGQLDAAMSLGMTGPQVFREILLPQAIRIMIPGWSNEFITVLKDTSIAFVLSFQDIMTRADLIARSIGRYLEIYIFVALLYFVLVRSSTAILNALYERNRIPGLGEKR